MNISWFRFSNLRRLLICLFAAAGLLIVLPAAPVRAGGFPGGELEFDTELTSLDLS